MMAARWGHAKALKTIMENPHRQPDLNATFSYELQVSTKAGDTVVDLSVRFGEQYCATLLLEAGAKLTDQLKQARS